MPDEFDAAVTLGSDGRTMHTGATRELSAVASEIAQIVWVMDARNRQRFQGDGQLLGVVDQREHGAGVAAGGVEGRGDAGAGADAAGGRGAGRGGGCEARGVSRAIAPEHRGMNRRRWSRLSAAVCLRGRRWAIDMLKTESGLQPEGSRSSYSTRW